MIIGARKIEEKAYVYFTLVQDITRDTESFIRGYKPSAIDSRLYIMSYENFLTRALVDLDPICPYGKWLFSIIPCESILTEQKEKQPAKV